MGKVAASLELRISASKPEILSSDKDWKKGDVPMQQGPEVEVVISEGVVKEVSQFKYWGSVTDGRLDVELNGRKGKALGRFKQSSVIGYKGEVLQGIGAASSAVWERVVV